MSYLSPMWRAAIYLCTASLTLALAQSPTKPAAAKSATETLPPLPTDATQYAREAFQHQLDADHTDHTHWRYRIHREDDKGSQDRDVIETKDGELARTLF
ncbi:MAG TPA: hypothetical protein VHA06_00530, partial [Candidatus Angelobacter sp.]|nr:hypothetical protein [Candidatus Angelobacter sp.]